MSKKKRYQIRKTPSRGWAYRIIYEDGMTGFEHDGFWSEEAAHSAAREDIEGKTEWHEPARREC